MSSQIWIASTALACMEQDACEYFPLETGGLLVGYRLGPNQVVTAIIGAGERAVRTKISFEADHDYQCAELDRFFFDSMGVTVYLGDWHTHPSSSPELSGTDRRTLARIARHSPANCTSPLMLVGGGSPGRWIWKTHLYDRTKVWRKIHSCSFRVFGSMVVQREEAGGIASGPGR